MVPVPADDPDFCIDAYEASIEDGLPVSVAGVMPAEGVSFDEARELCASVHAVTAEGEDLGPMWLATLPQWTDAADGVVGDGGSSYPYGDTWRDDACATPTADGTVVLESEVETGSFPECVSAFGVYDQVGNVWEWADPEIDADADGWLDARAAEGREFAFTHDGWMQLVGGTVDGLTLQVAGLGGPFPTVDGDGFILVSHDDLQVDDPDFAYKGFFTPEDMGEARGDDFLPVQVDVTTDLDGFHPVVFLPEEDGAAVTAKVGCAWYTGNETGCRLTSVYLFHTHDFDGSISFRCASPPLR
ncbi:MAG: hypothetical protein D6798_03740 [Deltaproteobacteria bacterium]|nr:MAG: hypothetical protein D6798_03740 [Deltaproteobacteria bacterium]